MTIKLYPEHSWFCPNCKTYYPEKRIGKTVLSFLPLYRKCEFCGKSFDKDDRDITRR